MEIRKLKNGWQFVNNWRSNRSGFVHETTLFRIEFKDRTYEYVKDDLALEEAKKKSGNKIINVIYKRKDGNYGLLEPDYK